MTQFPPHFIYGAATAAYQAEGATDVDGKGKTYWDDYLKKQGLFDPSESCDFYHQYPVDLKLAQEFGLNGVRISIAWTRIFPEGSGIPNEKGVSYYHQLLDECLQHGLEPFVTLHHFDTPLPLYEKGDWLSSEMTDAYVRYAEFCFQEFGDKVKYWITINEPISLACGQYLVGHFPPNIYADMGKAVQAQHNMMVAHARAVKVFKEQEYPGEIGIVHILDKKYPISDAEGNKDAALRDHVLTNQFLVDATFKGFYAPDTMEVIQRILDDNGSQDLETSPQDFEFLNFAAKNIDFLGVNYYSSQFVEEYQGESMLHHNGTGEKGTAVFALKGVGRRVINPDVPTTDWDWPIYPQGLEDILLWLKERYENLCKVYITENGMGSKEALEHGTVDDSYRIEYIRSHLESVLKAVERGVDVRGYFLWSLMDLLSWTNGYSKRYGLFYVDFETQRRYPKKSAYWYRQMSQERRLPPVELLSEDIVV